MRYGDPGPTCDANFVVCFLETENACPDFVLVSVFSKWSEDSAVLSPEESVKQLCLCVPVLNQR